VLNLADSSPEIQILYTSVEDNRKQLDLGHITHAAKLYRVSSVEGSSVPTSDVL